MSKLNLEDFDIEYNPKSEYITVKEKNTGRVIGDFPYGKSTIEVFNPNSKYVELPEFLTLREPFLLPEYRQKGLGQQIYKKIEELTNKKILPDKSLSQSALALHSKKGLGKSFGKDEYGPDIIRQITNKVKGKNAQDIANQSFERLKKIIQAQGLSDFKSIAPLLAKGAGTAVAGLASLAAEAADTEDEGSALEEAAMQREKQEENFKKAIGEDAYYASKQNLRNTSPMELLDPMANKPQFRTLRNKLK